MKISDIIEGKLPNKNIVFDILKEISQEPREIKQTYNKCYRDKLKSPVKKRVTLLWAQYMLMAPRYNDEGYAEFYY